MGLITFHMSVPLSTNNISVSVYTMMIRCRLQIWTKPHPKWLVSAACNPLVLNNAYKLFTKSYIVAGKDGYDVFRVCKVLVNEEEGPIVVYWEPSSGITLQCVRS